LGYGSWPTRSWFAPWELITGHEVVTDGLKCELQTADDVEIYRSF
jgi:hypothetical protein